VLGDAVGVGDTAPPSDGEGETTGEGAAARDGDTEGELGLARPTAGPSWNKSEDMTTTSAPSASSPTTAKIGASGTCLPSGRRSRQLGQKPETGVVTYPQFRHRTGRRFPAMACLVAFSMRDRF
jgi:hypothetical protein